MIRLLRLLLACALGLLPSCAVGPGPGSVERTEVCVYGGTSAGVVAAVYLARAGREVILVSPHRHPGGLTVSGLGMTDTGDRSVIGGLSREFYQRVKRVYDRAETWRWQEAGAYRFYRPDEDAQWRFEPSVARRVMEQMLEEAGVRVWREDFLDRSRSLQLVDGRIRRIRLLSGRIVEAGIFMDASYEGDLMALAGVSYHVGREANEVYGETLNGVQTGNAVHHQFEVEVDPYRVLGDPGSGLLPNLHAGPPGVDGGADERVQAYCFRMCITRHKPNLRPFEKPADYDPLQYELLGRAIDAGWRSRFWDPAPMPNHKTDTNNNGPFSTDYIGANYDYPEASYAEREEIVAAHERYQRGLLWFLSQDPRVPAELRQRFAAWGHARDEFVDNDNWPDRLYIREARRMVSDYVHTEQDCFRRRQTPESVGMGSYNMDSHNVQRYVDAAGRVRNEGDVQVSPGGAYQISYRSIRPRREECLNLLVPVCVSASHIAYGSIRMEPVFMVLGHSAAAAADIALSRGCALQDVPYAHLRERLLSEGQVLEKAQ